MDANVRSEVDAQNRALADATKAKSASGMASVYSENATFVGPDGSAVTGRKAIETMWGAQLAAGLRAVDLETQSLEELAPGLYVEMGKYRVHVGEGSDAGRYMVVWKRSAAGKLEIQVDLPASHGG